MVEVIQSGGLFNPNATYPVPIPFGGMGHPVNQHGYSDHFPIGPRVEEAQTK
jgi:hypothetical protein